VEIFQNRHKAIFGPQKNKNNKGQKKAAEEEKRRLRADFIKFLKEAFKYFPQYVVVEYPENCNFPVGYKVDDYYSDLSTAICFYCNGSHAKNQEMKSIFETLPPSPVHLTSTKAIPFNKHPATTAKWHYILKLNQPFYTVEGIFFFNYFYNYYCLFCTNTIDIYHYIYRKNKNKQFNDRKGNNAEDPDDDGQEDAEKKWKTSVGFQTPAVVGSFEETTSFNQGCCCIIVC
jgi:hypothetical protein